jgi:Holliday junction resolvase-like predicted endonuclease
MDDDGPARGRRTPAQQRGDAAEDLVAAELVGRGWTILGRRVRLGRQELDIVAIDPGPGPELVVVEVRWRVRRDHGLAEESIDHAKRARLRLAAGRLADAVTLPGGTTVPRLPIRIDVVAVEPGATAGSARTRHHRHAV